MAVTKIELREWQATDPTKDSCLKGKFFTDDAQRAVAERISKSGILSITELRTGLALRSSSHVGRFRIGDIEVTVRPKIEGSHLLRLLRYAYGLRDLRLLDRADYDFETRAFQDLLIHQLVNEVRDLIARGLHRKYVRRAEDLMTPRGRIDVNRFAARGPALSAALPCVHHPRTEDCLENKVLASGLGLALELTTDGALRSRLHLLRSLIRESVADLQLSTDSFRALDRQRSRLTTAYEPAFTIIRMLFDGSGVSITGDARRATFSGFMFDMNRFFQRLISRLLHESVPDLVVRDEFALKGMMQFVPGMNPRRRRAPQPRPDFVLLRKRQVVGILDSKYRDLWETPLPREMLYQLAIYAMSQSSCRGATILYPATNPLAEPAAIAIQDPLTGSRRATVTLQPVDLIRLADIVEGVDSFATSRAKREFGAGLLSSIRAGVT